MSWPVQTLMRKPTSHFQLLDEILPEELQTEETILSSNQDTQLPSVLQDEYELSPLHCAERRAEQRHTASFLIRKETHTSE